MKPKMSTFLLSALLVACFAKICAGNGCSASYNIEELRRLRLKQLKNSILAQLGFTEPPPPIPQNTTLNRTSAADIIGDELGSDVSPQPKCTSDEFYAKPINSFVGILSPTEGLVARYRRQVKNDEDKEGSDNDGGEDVIVQPSTINQYNISINFNLPENLTDVTKAHLLLYQDEANTLNHNSGQYQLVLIRAIVNNVRYHIEEKKLDVYKHGLQTFDVTRAAELWIEQEVSGSTTLEVLVTCLYSAPNCIEDSDMARVSFTDDTANYTRRPRVITISRNPLENTHRDLAVRRRRQAIPANSTNVTEYNYCQTNESTCCLQPLEINFAEDLDMPFIIRPKKFTANFCQGYCPDVLGLELEVSERSQLLQFLRNSPATAVEPCCAGLEYDSLNIVGEFFNTTTQKLEVSDEVLDQVTVTRCTCG